MPPELYMAWIVERFGLDAVFEGAPPARLLKRMAAAANIHAAFMSYRAGSSRLANWARANPAQSKIVYDIRMLRQND